MNDKPRGHCRTCNFHGRLRKDGTLYRHWPGFLDQVGPNGYCTGWKQLPAREITT